MYTIINYKIILSIIPIQQIYSLGLQTYDYIDRWKLSPTGMHSFPEMLVLREELCTPIDSLRNMQPVESTLHCIVEVTWSHCTMWIMGHYCFVVRLVGRSITRSVGRSVCGRSFGRSFVWSFGGRSVVEVGRLFGSWSVVRSFVGRSVFWKVDRSLIIRGSVGRRFDDRSPSRSFVRSFGRSFVKSVGRLVGLSNGRSFGHSGVESFFRSIAWSVSRWLGGRWFGRQSIGRSFL